ncbi:uncharacterized protein TM35_000171210 [Trypanosoma theileri]|uniref:Transmembrane protein n=1 Tax=Trypanosoma theileri TaxID=67003 RepID=A0A1X0NVK6_9TRYP|nr:uncharacterized protein TM35_000171210 [Trypanosoma theileri]ORC88249.1 hypothetical protein TM35_000171210 [Trypanosoma theileri]
MSALIQRLMELGEEPSNTHRLTTSSELNNKATKDELVSQVVQLQNQLADQKRKYDDLLADATKLRSEYDAYRRMAEREKRQYVEQRSEDRRMLDELRRAGASGKMDETYVRETEAKVADLQDRLRKALEEVERTYKRQLEAEHARVAAETAKKDEVQELCQQFERFKETMRQRNEQLEQQLSEARKAVVVSTASSQLSSTQQDKALTAVSNGGSEVKEDEIPSGAGVTVNDDVSHLQALLSAASQREKQLQTELAAEQTRYQRQVEEANWETMEAGKKIAELRTEIDTWRSKTSQLESALESKGEEHTLKERDLRHSLRQAEDNVARLQRELQDVKETAENKRQEYEHALIREREAVAKRTVMADEAECLTKSVNEAMQEQRVHYERLLHEREVALQEQQGICRALEAALRESREDKHQQTDRMDDLRQELDQCQHTISELELMQAQSQRLIALREEEVMSKEGERQKLRRLLREEEEAHHRTRQRMVELETQQSETELISARHAAVTEETSNRLVALERECNSARGLVEVQQSQLQTKEQTIRQLQLQLDELIAQSAKFAYYREEQAAKARQFEGRIRELEAERSASVIQQLQTENFSAQPIFSTAPLPNVGNASNNNTSSPFELLYAAPSERVRQQFVSEAVMSARKLRLAASSRLRKVVLFSMACILIVILTASYFTASPNANSVGAMDAAIDSLQQRYTSASEALKKCQASLAMCSKK